MVLAKIFVLACTLAAALVTVSNAAPSYDQPRQLDPKYHNTQDQNSQWYDPPAYWVHTGASGGTKDREYILGKLFGYPSIDSHSPGSRGTKPAPAVSKSFDLSSFCKDLGICKRDLPGDGAAHSVPSTEPEATSLFAPPQSPYAARLKRIHGSRGNSSLDTREGELSVVSYIRFSLPMTIGGQILDLVVDTGASDTWVVSSDFKCGSGTCLFDDKYIIRDSFHQLNNSTFFSAYAGGSISVTGIAGTESVSIAGLPAFEQVIGLAKTVRSDPISFRVRC